MNNIFNFDTQLLLQALGAIFIGLGVVIRLGIWKKWYWRSKSSVYWYIPIGFVFLLYSFNDQVQTLLGTLFWIYYIAYAILVFLGLWWVFRPPGFIKPDWVLWVEAYPENTYLAMQADAERDTGWERHVDSPESVQIWALSLERGMKR